MENRHIIIRDIWSDKRSVRRIGKTTSHFICHFMKHLYLQPDFLLTVIHRLKLAPDVGLPSRSLKTMYSASSLGPQYLSLWFLSHVIFYNKNNDLFSIYLFTSLSHMKYRKKVNISLYKKYITKIWLNWIGFSIITINFDEIFG